VTPSAGIGSTCDTTQVPDFATNSTSHSDRDAAGTVVRVPSAATKS
jgi:hypothetical protein